MSVDESGGTRRFPAGEGKHRCTMMCSSNLTTVERGPVQTYQIYVSKGRDRVDEIRSELFVFPEILDVFTTGRPDSLVVVCRGRPRPAEWLRALRTVGYDLPPRSHSRTLGAKVDRTTVAAPLRREPLSAPIMRRRAVKTYYAL
jgi:hypothetical protein